MLSFYYYRSDWLTSSVHLWHQLGCLYILGPSSAGTAASSLADHQTTSIHQHKSAQRGANCIRRPSLFFSGVCGCGCVFVWSRVSVIGKRRRLVRSMGCLRSRGGRVWWCVVGAGQAHKPSGRRPLRHLCSCWQCLRPLSHTKTHTCRKNIDKYTISLPSTDHSQQHRNKHIWSLFLARS